MTDDTESDGNVPLARMWQQVEDRQGLIFKTQEEAYQICWQQAGLHKQHPFVVIELERDLGIPAEKLRALRCDFLSAESGKADSDGFWLLVEKAVKKDSAFGDKYCPFWHKVFPRSSHRSHTDVANGNAARLDHVYTFARLELLRFAATRREND